MMHLASIFMSNPYCGFMKPIVMKALNGIIHTAVVVMECDGLGLLRLLLVYKLA
jgi:hypothetical protein